MEMLTRCLFVAFVAIGLIGVTPAAQATVYDFSYTANVGVVSGTIVGTLQPDNNTIFVSSIVNPEFDGVAAPALPVLTTLADFFSTTGPTTAEVSLDGINNNILACVTSACVDGFFLDAAGVDAMFTGTPPPGPQFGAGPSYGGGMTVYEEYNPSHWTITAVPAPAALPLFASGLAGLGWLSRRKRKQPIAA